MKIISDINEANDYLNQYKNGYLQIFLYSIRHNRLLLKLEKEGNNDIVCILAIGCVQFSGSFSLNKTNLAIHMPNKYDGMSLNDTNNEFELVTNSTIGLLIGDINEFGIEFQKSFI